MWNYSDGCDELEIRKISISNLIEVKVVQPNWDVKGLFCVFIINTCHGRLTEAAACDIIKIVKLTEHKSILVYFMVYLEHLIPCGMPALCQI